MVNVIIKHGWIFIIIAVLGELLVPFLLAPFYKGYDHSAMAISALGSKGSPVRKVSKPLSVVTALFLAVFAIGACIFTCFFSVNDSKDVVTTASRIHGAGSAIGFMLMLFVPLLLAILSFKTGEKASGIMGIVSFVLALTFFVLFVMADKPEFQNTVIAKEGLWQRLNLLCMYLPLFYVAIMKSRS
ncbi:MAG: DUF998 domain-containing protein [Lachnospiraceae bacterium]|nr:DUF998 domain-containing protein [Lachnospiraceae bacterium]